MDIDKPLDDIVSANRQKKRSTRRNSGRAQVLGKTGPSPASKARASAVSQPAKQQATAPSNSDKIVVSNLPMDVNDAQVKELFATTVGPLRQVSIHYDAHGKSKGVAEVTFQRKGDATKAFQQYNNRLIDGKRPMKIEIILDPSKPQPLSARVAPAPTNGTQQARTQRPTKSKKPGKPRVKQTPKTAADLDAEMEDYTASSAAPPTAPAAS
jgi:THO complex subunit 4